MNVFSKFLLISAFFILPEISVSTEENAEETKSKTELKVSFPQPSEEIKATTQDIKIDDETTAKITIATTADKKEETANIEKDNKETNNDDKNIEIEKKVKNKNAEELKNTVIEKNNNTVQNKSIDQTVNIVGTYDMNKQNTIVLKEGTRNITINFQPKINTSCNENKACKTQEERIQAKERQKKNNKKKVIKRKIASKTNKKLSQTPEQIQLQPSSNNNLQSSTKIYNSSELSCVGEECNTVNAKTNEAIQMQTNYNINNFKTTTQMQQPVYVINRIISVDEDMDLSDETIKQLAHDTGGQVSVVGNGARFSSSIRGDGSNKFKQKYDLITADQLSYGEVAFVDDYNN